jgi:hypothetical protein
VRANPRTEERIIRAVEGSLVTIDTPLDLAHFHSEECRGEVADLSRNVIIESADPGGVRGHTMYHRDSSGSISYAEFRHLGKRGKLGKYSIHFHRPGDTMRGSSVIGASIWDSANRWITIHGTNDLVVRDCVGYGSIDFPQVRSPLSAMGWSVGWWSSVPWPADRRPLRRSPGRVMRRTRSIPPCRASPRNCPR